MSNLSEEEDIRMDFEDNETWTNISDQVWHQEEATAKLVLEGMRLPTISSFGFLGTSYNS